MSVMDRQGQTIFDLIENEGDLPENLSYLDSRYLKTASSKDCTNSNFPKSTINFKFNVDNDDWVDLNKSFISMKTSLTKANGQQLDLADDVAYSYNTMSNLFKQIDFKMNGKTVESITSGVAEQSSLLIRQNKSEQWQNTIGGYDNLIASYNERLNETASDGVIVGSNTGFTTSVNLSENWASMYSALETTPVTYVAPTPNDVGADCTGFLANTLRTSVLPSLTPFATANATRGFTINKSGKYRMTISGTSKGRGGVTLPTSTFNWLYLNMIPQSTGIKNNIGNQDGNIVPTIASCNVGDGDTFLSTSYIKDLVAGDIVYGGVNGAVQANAVATGVIFGGSYSTASGKINISNDNGTSYTSSTNQPFFGFSNSLTVGGMCYYAPTGRLFAGRPISEAPVLDAQGFYSDNGGQSWNSYGQGLLTAPSRTISKFRTNNTQIIAIESQSIYWGTGSTGLNFSNNGGLTWTNLTLAPLGRINEVCFSPAKLHIVSNQGYFSTPLPVTALSVFTANNASPPNIGSHLYRQTIAYNNGVLMMTVFTDITVNGVLYRSTDDGITFTQVGFTAGSDIPCAVNQVDNDQSGLNMEFAWSPYNGVSNGLGTWMAISSKPLDYVGTATGGQGKVFTSTDNGLTWNSLNTLYPSFPNNIFPQANVGIYYSNLKDRFYVGTFSGFESGFTISNTGFGTPYNVRTNFPTKYPESLVTGANVLYNFQDAYQLLSNPSEIRNLELTIEELNPSATVSGSTNISNQRITGKQLIWKPCLSMFNLPHALPQGQYELILYPYEDGVYQKRAIESKNSSKVPGVDFKFNVDECEFYSNLVKGYHVKNKEFLIDLRCMRVMNRDVDSNTEIQENEYVMDDTTYGVTFALQDKSNGLDTRYPPSKFKCQNKLDRALVKLGMNYAGQQVPYNGDFDPEYNTLGVDYRNAMYLYSMMNTGMYFDPAGAESFTSFDENGFYVYVPFNKDVDENDTRLNIRTQFSSNPINMEYLVVSHYKKVIKVKIQNSKVINVEELVI